MSLQQAKGFPSALEPPPLMRVRFRRDPVIRVIRPKVRFGAKRKFELGRCSVTVALADAGHGRHPESL